MDEDQGQAKREAVAEEPAPLSAPQPDPQAEELEENPEITARIENIIAATNDEIKIALKHTDDASAIAFFLKLFEETRSLTRTQIEAAYKKKGWTSSIHGTRSRVNNSSSFLTTELALNPYTKNWKEIWRLESTNIETVSEIPESIAELHKRAEASITKTESKTIRIILNCLTNQYLGIDLSEIGEKVKDEETAPIEEVIERINVKSLRHYNMRIYCRNGIAILGPLSKKEPLILVDNKETRERFKKRNEISQDEGSKAEKRTGTSPKVLERLTSMEERLSASEAALREATRTNEDLGEQLRTAISELRTTRSLLSSLQARLPNGDQKPPQIQIQIPPDQMGYLAEEALAPAVTLIKQLVGTTREIVTMATRQAQASAEQESLAQSAAMIEQLATTVKEIAAIAAKQTLALAAIEEATIEERDAALREKEAALEERDAARKIAEQAAQRADQAAAIAEQLFLRVQELTRTTPRPTSHTPPTSPRPQTAPAPAAPRPTPAAPTQPPAPSATAPATPPAPPASPRPPTNPRTTTETIKTLATTLTPSSTLSDVKTAITIAVSRCCSPFGDESKKQVAIMEPTLDELITTLTTIAPTLQDACRTPVQQFLELCQRIKLAKGEDKKPLHVKQGVVLPNATRQILQGPK